MDAKLPNVPVAHPDHDGAFAGDTLPENQNPKLKGMTGGGEASTLARTEMTVKEAIEMGYNLSPREIAAAGGPDGKMPWVVGTVANVVDPSAAFIQEGAANSLPQKAGISGTTFRFMEAAQMLGGDPNHSSLAMLGALQVIDAHTVYEIRNASKGFGLEFDPQNPYSHLGIDRAVLEQLAKQSGTSLGELNNETKTTMPKGDDPAPVS
jgi:hypothetical protein